MSSSKRHVFVFRHCLRSTESTVDLHDGKQEKDLSFFFPNLPKWNVPEYWCTQEGMRLLEATGRFLATKHLLGDKVGATTRLKIISDLVQRDVDSSLALSNGMAFEGVSVSRSIELDPTLFMPTEANDFDADAPLCDPVDDSVILEQVKANLKRFTPPDTISNGMKQLIELGNATNITIPDHNHDKPELQPKDSQFIGPINLIKIFAQNLFYSRASKIPYLPTLTAKQIMSLQPWINWSRRVLSTETSEAAQNGAAMAHLILQTLNTSSLSSNNESLLIMGHDSNLDSLGTLLGAHWEFPEYGSNNLNPTPPGSGFHFVHDEKTSLVSVTMIYPVYNLEVSGQDDDDYDVAMELKEVQVMEDMTLDSLNQTFVRELNRYKGAMSCFQAAAAAYQVTNAGDTNNASIIPSAAMPTSTSSLPAQPQQDLIGGSDNVSSRHGGNMWFAFFVIGAGLWVFLRRGQRHSTYESYTGVELM